jgi:hypothetical protein
MVVVGGKVIRSLVFQKSSVTVDSGGAVAKIIPYGHSFWLPSPQRHIHEPLRAMFYWKMQDEYKVKVLVTRLSFLVIFIGGLILYVYDMTDYLIILGLLIAFVGIFPMSHVDVSFENIKIRKNYFWALVGIIRTIEYDQVESIRSKDYSIETHEEAFLFTDTVAETLAVDLNRPMVNWSTAKLTFRRKEKTKSIELKLTRGEFRDIERRIKHST